MASFLDLIDKLPDLLEKGGPYLVVTVILVWLVYDLLKRLDKKDEAHIKERNQQSAQHRAQVSALLTNHRAQSKEIMDNHSLERSEWVATLKEASAEFSEASVNQGDRLATALINALGNRRS